jgi:hypothetical protein
MNAKVAGAGTPIRVGLVGIGSWAQHGHLRVLKLLPEYELSALYSQIGIGAGLATRPLPHHRAYGSVHGGSDQLAGYLRNDGRPREPR